MNKDEVVYLHYVHKIKIRVELIRNLTIWQYPANTHSVSLGTFVQCTVLIQQTLDTLPIYICGLTFDQCLQYFQCHTFFSC